MSRVGTWVAPFIGLMVLSVGAPGCGGGSGGPAESPTALASQRLQGNWRLMTFQPSLALEEPLKGLLDAQLQALTISFASGAFTASGPSVNTSGRYEISAAEGDSLSGRVYDRAGAGYGITGQFVGNQFRFTSTDSPWAGAGVLERAP
jgi:hypothetical protein